MLDGSIVPAPIELTCGVVVQLYQLFFVHKPPAFTSPRVGFYRVLSALAQTGGGAVQPEAADMHLLVQRMARKPNGLYVQVREAAKQRRHNSATADMDEDGAWNHHIKRFDKQPFAFSFISPPAPPPPPPSEPPPETASSPPPSPPSFAGLDPRTQEFAFASVSAAYKSWRQLEACDSLHEMTHWHDSWGDFPIEILCIIDGFVPKELPPPSHQAKRSATFERQLVAVRKQLDEAREAADELRVQLGEARSAAALQ